MHSKYKLLDRIGSTVSKTDVKRIMRFVVTTLKCLEELIDLKSAYELNF